MEALSATTVKDNPANIQQKPLKCDIISVPKIPDLAMSPSNIRVRIEYR